MPTVEISSAVYVRTIDVLGMQQTAGADGLDHGVPRGVAVIEDHDLLRAGICSLLDSIDSLQLIASGSTLSDAVSAVADPRVAVLVLSVDLPGVPAGTAVARVVRAAPAISVVAITSRPQPAARRDALSAGAATYLTTAASSRELLDAIRREARWPRIEVPAMRDRPEPPESEVTARELEVLQLIAQALSNRSIAVTLDISEGTVKRHTNNVYRKLQVGSRVHAVNEGRRRGLLA
jgi:DNA-binding NarL/FixJ family response regulator